MSPKLFMANLKKIFLKIVRKNKGLFIDAEFLNHLRFVDNIVLNAQDIISDLNAASYELVDDVFGQDSIIFKFRMSIPKKRYRNLDI